MIYATLLYNGWMAFDYWVCESKFEHLLTPNGFELTGPALSALLWGGG